jgi:hypothetical protein
MGALWLAGGLIALSQGVARASGHPGAVRGLSLAAALTYTSLTALSAIGGDPVGSGLAAFLAMIWWLNWWLDRGGRRRKKRSLKALGNKARAAVEAMLRNMPKPGPVLRPAPQGAPA